MRDAVEKQIIEQSDNFNLPPQQKPQSPFIEQSKVDFEIRSAAGLKRYFILNKREKFCYRPSQAMKLCLRFAARLAQGQLDITLPDGTVLRFIGHEAGRVASLKVNNDRMARRFLIGGRLGFCEAYHDGDWSSPDITSFFTLILENSEIMRKALHGKRWYRWLSGALHALKPNSRKGARKNIYKHYDIGNSFYSEWLDPSMTYSSALFSAPNQSLYEAQQNKYANLASLTDIQPHHSVLEIGCGWGGMAEHLLQSRKAASVTGLTISQEQHAYAAARLETYISDKQCDIRLEDYRDAGGQYDRIVSIEMFEAVGEQYWDTYFTVLRERLVEGGKAGLQIITIADDAFESYRKSADYIQRYIFPGGMLPSKSVLHKLAAKHGFTVEAEQDFGQDYATTLIRWQAAFQAKWPVLAERFDLRFKRLWEQYLAYCAAGFQAGTIDVIQIILVKT